MAPVDSSSKALNAVARALGWLTSVATMVVLGFIVNRWPTKAGPVAAGIVGVAVALLNDSWQMVSVADRSIGFPPLAPGRALLHDMFSMAICMGGVVLIVFSGYAMSDEERAAHEEQRLQNLEKYGQHDTFDPIAMLRTGQWFLVAVVAWRLIFAVWGCRECVKLGPQNRARRQQQRRRRSAAEMAEAGRAGGRPSIARMLA